MIPTIGSVHRVLTSLRAAYGPTGANSQRTVRDDCRSKTGMGGHKDETEAEALRAEWRRLRRTALFFAACVGIVLALVLVGSYH
jgi:hypothetical protein